MWQKIFHLILRLFRRIDNPVKQIEDDAAFLPEKDAIKFLPEPDAEEEITEAVATDIAGEIDAEIIKDLAVKPPPTPEPDPWALRWEILDEIVERPFDSPLEVLPSRRYPKKDVPGVYSIFGRAPKEKGNKKYPKAKRKVFENLPGKWNKNRPRLYMEIHMGQHFREGLARAEELEERLTELDGEQYDVISYPYSIGSLSHRHIQNNPKKPLSYHSWPIAFDQNPGWNRGINYATKWIKRIKKTVNGKKKTIWVPASFTSAKKGPVNTVLPFSKQYYACFPKSVPFEFVLAMKSVGFCWGGDWGRSAWHEVVRKFGVGYDQNDPKVNKSKIFTTAMKQWASMRYYDGMHFELTTRGKWARELWARQQEALEDNIHV